MKEKKDIHTKIDYDSWFLAQTNNLKWSDIFKVGIKLLLGKSNTKTEVEQRIKDAEQAIKQKHREIEYWKETKAKLEKEDIQKAKIEAKRTIQLSDEPDWDRIIRGR